MEGEAAIPLLQIVRRPNMLQTMSAFSITVASWSTRIKLLQSDAKPSASKSLSCSRSFSLVPSSVLRLKLISPAYLPLSSSQMKV